MKNRIFSSPFSRLPLSSLLLTFLTLFAASVASAQIPSTGLVGYWPFCGNANDESGNGNNGTVNGAVASLCPDRDGNLNSAYNFQNALGGITVNSFDFPEGNYTVSAWVNVTLDPAAVSSKNIISHDWNNGGEMVLFLNEPTSQSVNFDCKPNTGNSISASVNSNEWNHLVMQRLGLIFRLYLNGVLIQEGNKASMPIIPNNNLFFGGDPVGSQYSLFNGKIDDISIYNRALTPSEITQLYTDQTSTVATPPCPTLATNLQTGLVGYWPFCGNANDESGNGNNGTVNGATLTTDRFGNANSAYNFDGVNDWIEVLHSASLSFPSSTQTISFWIQIPSSPTPPVLESVMSKYSGSGSSLTGFTMHFTLESLFYSVKNGWASNSWGDCFLPTTSLTPYNNFKHVVFSNDNDSLRCYVNGVHVSSSNLLSDVLLGQNIYPLVFGKENEMAYAGGLSFFHGKLDDICIWDRALTPTEITQLYTDPSTTPPVACTPFLGEDQTVCAGGNVTLSSNFSSCSGLTIPSTWNYVGSYGFSTYYIDPTSKNIPNWLSYLTSISPNAQLVCVETPGESQFLYTALLSYFSSHSSFTPWCGAFQNTSSPSFSEPSDGWQWYNGGQWGNLPWAQTQPDNYQGVQQNARLDYGSQPYLAMDDIESSYTTGALIEISCPYSILWSTGATTATINVTPTTTTTYTCTVTDANGNVCTDSVTVFVPQIEATDLTICAGETTTLSVSGINSAATPSACPTLPTNLQTGLVGYWPFCGNANDASGNGNNGTVNGSQLTNDSFGNLNSAYSFNTNSHIYVPFSSSLNTIQTGLTMSSWIYMDGGTGSGTPPRILELRGGYGGGGNAGFVMLSQGNSNTTRTFEVRWYNNNGNTNISVSPTFPVSALSWHHVAFSCDGLTGIGKFYLDGVLLNTNASQANQGLISSCNYNNNGLFIGAEPNLLGKWGGKIDELVLHNRALSAIEIQQLFQMNSNSYLWSNGATTPTINVSPTSTTTYTCTITANGVSCTDSVTVAVNNPVIDLGADVTVCGSSTTLTAPSGYDSYVWSNGGTTNTTTVNASGTYSCAITEGLCAAEDSIDVMLLSTNIIASDTLICSGESVNLASAFNNLLIGSTNVPNSQNCYGWGGPSITSSLLNSNGFIDCVIGQQVDLYMQDNYSPMMLCGVSGFINPPNTIVLSSSCQGNGIYETIKFDIPGIFYVQGHNGDGIANTTCIIGIRVKDIGVLWSNGATTSTINVSPTSTTSYTCTITANGFSCTDSVTVVVSNPVIDLGADVTVCGTSTTLTAPSGYDSYLWSNGGTTNTTTVSSNGTYSCTVTQGGCSATDSLNVTLIDATITASDSIICAGEITTLSVNAIPSSPNSTFNSVLFPNPVLFNGHFYSKYTGTANWFNAKTICETNGGYLAIPNSIAESDFIQVLSGVDQPATWIGLSDQTAEGTWIDVQGNPVTFFNWYPGEPNNVGDEDFVYIYNQGTALGGWNDSHSNYLLPFVLETNSIPSQILWSNGATTPTINVSPTSTTTYTCTITTNGVSCTDTVTVAVNNSVIDLGADVTVCGTSTTLTAPSGYESYLWSNGGTTNTTTVSSNGTYSCTVTQGGCSATDAVDVTLVNATISASDSTICAGETVTLSVPQGGATNTACATLPTNLQTGLVGYWPFCGNANDASGNGNNGTVNGATLTTDRFGNANSAYSFDGNDYVSTAVTRGQLTSNFSISFFERYTGSSSAIYSAMIGGSDATGGTQFFIGKNAGNTHLGLEDGNYNGNFTTNGAFFDGQWNHMVIVKIAGVIYLYRNGNLEAQGNFVGCNDSEALIFGNEFEGPGYFWNGQLDDILMFNRSLSTSEIQQLYNLIQTSYSWSNGATTPTINVSPTTTTTYTCTVTTNGVSCTDSVTVVVSNPFIDLGADVTVCGTSTTLTAPSGYDSYLWSNGGTTNITTVNASGIYTCTVTQGGCSATDAVDVTLVNATASASDSTICAGETVTLSVPQGGSSSTACAALPTNLQTGLVGYWPFCGNANDASGNGNNGTVNGATLTTDRFGNANSAYGFDGNDGIDCGNSSMLDLTSNYSVAYWYQKNGSDMGAVLSKNNGSGGQNKYVLGVNQYGSNGDFCHWHNGPTPQWRYTGIPIDAQWNFIVWKFNGQTIEFYKNGVFVQSFLLDPTFPQISANMIIGNTEGIMFWNGIIDELMMFNRQLSQEEIQQLYTLGQTTYLWSNGTTTPTINVSPTSTTTYTCTVTTNGVSCTDSLTVVVSNPVIDLGADVTVCGTSTTLTAPSGYDSYLWSNGGTTNTTTVTTNGTYSCTVTQGGCNATDSIDVTLIDATIIASDSIVCAGETVTLSVPLGGSISTACAALPTNLQTGLVGYWPFCGNANDASGNGNNGSVNGAALTTDRFGSANGAYSFDGYNDLIRVPHQPNLNLLGDYSISVWLEGNFQNLFNNNWVLIAKRDDAGTCCSPNVPYDFFIPFNSTNYAVPGMAYANGGYSFATPPNNITVPLAGWQNVIITNSSDNLNFFVNGNLVYTTNFPSSLRLPNTSDLLIGSVNREFGAEWMSGKLDDIGTWSRALTAEEIQQLYTLGQTTYLWSNGATTPTLNVSPTSTTTYTCTVTTNGVSCTDSVTVVVSQPVASITPNGIVEICQGQSIALTANGGISYLWNTGAPTQSITVNTEAVYTVTVTDANGCTDTESQLVKVNFLPNIGVNNGSICPGQSTTLTATGGLSYVWSPATGLSSTTGTTVTASPSTSTLYTVTGTGANGCTNTATAAVAVNAAPTATITPATATTFCQGGSVVLNANTGTGLTYQWFNNAAAISGATSSSYTANASGSYTVVVTNTSTCSATSTATVVTVNALPTATITPATATTFCQGGSVVLNANTGTGLTYQWRLNGTNITGATTSTYTANASGSYTVVVTNTSTCSATSTATVVNVNTPPTATITPLTTTTFCQGASVVLNANTGTGLSYQWFSNAVAISGATSASYTANASGSYTVIVTNTSTCSATSTATVVTVNALPTATITPATATTFCQGGSVVLNANAGAGLTYQWRLNGNPISGATSSSYAANASGSYTVVVTNASTCSATSTATVVTVNALPTATITPATATTFCQGGSVVLNANTGAGLTYQWRLNGTNITGATSSSYTANASGSYTVVVTNTGTCSATSSATVVTVNALPTATITPATTTTFCQGGSVVLNANTGAGLSYQWRLNGNPISGATSSSYTANASGSYTVVVTNTSTCSSTSTATVVTVNALPTATITPATATTFCQGGSVVLNANTGVGLTYQWRLNGNTISGATSSSYTANASGSYTVVVTNTSACSATSIATVVTVNALPTATITPATATTFCQGGSVVLNANTGAGLSYQWRLNGTNITGATSSSYTANASGSYTVVVTNTSTCSATSTATVVTVNALPTATITASSATTFCQGSSVVLTANTGAGLSYQWFNNAVAISGATASSYTANASGSYTVVVTNTSTCAATSTATVVTVNALPIASISPNGLVEICEGQSIALTANGGVSYLWSTGAPTQSITVNTEALYTVTVTDINGCTDTESQFVKVNQLPNIAVNNASICAGQSATLTATGGLSYVWSPATGLSATTGSTVSSSTTTNAAYTVTGTGANGCTNSATAMVTVNALPTATITPATATTFCQGGSVVLNANTGAGLSYQWRLNGTNITGATSSSYTANASGSYTVVVTNTSTCSATSTATVVTVNALPTATITPAAGTTFCQGGSVVLNANTGTGLSYQWFNNATAISGATTSNYTANASGSYTVVVTNTSTCSTTSTAINVTAVPNVDYFADADGDGFGDAATLISTCVQPQGYVTDNTDCDDTSADVNPAAAEVCNHIDDDCSGTIDDGLVFDTYYADVDGDTFGDASNSIYECSQPSGYVTNNTDCNDNNANQNTASTEICNGEDDDCDGAIDNGLIFLDYYADLDSDGFGAGAATNSCVDLGAGYVTNNTDCNDNNANQNAASAEICNGEDDDCDGTIDNGITFFDYYADTDGDGFGAGDVISSCSDLGAGYVTNNTDCDDSNSNTNPNATETCNTIDDNCDGQIDEGVQTVYFIDNDGDTYGNPSVSILACTQPIGYTPDDTDCNDTDANINPGAEDIGGNGIDENCDGEIDNSIFELNATISLYPNPTRSELNIQINSSIIGNDLYIFDAVGKLVFKQQLLSTQTTISVSNFADGNYVLKVGEVVKRFVVQK